MPRHQGLERHLVPRARVSGQELPVPEPDYRPRAEEVAEVPEGRPESCASPALSGWGHDGTQNQNTAATTTVPTSAVNNPVARRRRM